MSKISLLCAAVILLFHTPLRCNAWTTEPPRNSVHNTIVDRRSTLITGGASLASLVAWGGNPLSAFAGGSDLSAFQDGPRGIKYLVLQEGEGSPPQRAQKISAKYTLWTESFGEDGGKQVDSNTGFLGRPFSTVVGVGQVIKGWDLTLLDMKLGEKRRIVVPSDLGYGDKGAGGAIPPKATLYFELELTDIESMKELTEKQKQWLDEHPL